MRTQRNFLSLFLPLGAAILALTLPAAASAAGTLQVNGAIGADTGDCVTAPCRTIAYAIGQAAPHDKVQVAAGHYEEQLTIDQPLTLEGAAGGGTEIGPLGSDQVVAGAAITLDAGADETTLSDLELRSAAQYQPTIGTAGGEIDSVTITGVSQVGLGPSHVPSTVASGLELSVPTEGWTIADSSFDSDYMGILVGNDSSDLTVVDTTFTRDRNGFYVERLEPSPGVFVGEVDGLQMLECEFVENQYRGMYFEGLSNAEIVDPTVVKAGATAPTHPFGARGISFNLKAGDYEDIKVIGADVRESENEGISIQVRGSADDSAAYQLHPASLDSIEIAESTVVDNAGPGVVVENTSLLGSTTIVGSRIVGNAVGGIPSGDTASGVDAWYEGGTASPVDATDNWFGCNAGPGVAGAGCDTVNGAVEGGPWMVLTAAPEASVLPSGARTGVRAGITTDSAGRTGRFPTGPVVPVTFTATNGAVSPAGSALAGGTAFAAFTAGAAGAAGLTATVDNQTVSVPLTVQAPLEPPVETPTETPAETPVEKPTESTPSPSPAPVGAPAGAPAAVAIETPQAKAPPTVAPSGNVTVATVECASSSCEVEAKKPTITIGGQNYKIKVKLPATIAGGSSAPIKVILPKKVREALEAKGKGQVKLKLTVTTADGQKKTVTVTVAVKAKKGKKK